MEQSLFDTKIELAISEIVTSAQSILSREVIEKWMLDYSQLWQELKNELDPIPAPWEDIHGRPLCEFDSICTHFSVLIDYFRTEDICKDALKEYDSILLANSKKHDNLRLQQWVRNYEQNAYKHLCPLPIEDTDANNVKTIYDTAYVVPRSYFENSLVFYEVFCRLFWEEQILPDRIAEIRKQRRDELNKLGSGQ